MTEQRSGQEAPAAPGLPPADLAELAAERERIAAERERIAEEREQVLAERERLASEHALALWERTIEVGQQQTALAAGARAP